jgi:hypothetical protein
MLKICRTFGDATDVGRPVTEEICSVPEARGAGRRISSEVLFPVAFTFPAGLWCLAAIVLEAY